jgi:preprotein translocase subunit SecA
MVHAGELDRGRAIEFYRELFREIIRDAREGRRREIEFCTALVEYACDLYPEELMEEIDEAIELGLVDPVWIGKADVRGALARGKEAVLREAASENRLITDAVEELEDWECFHEDVDEEEDEADEPSSDFDAGEDDWPLPEARRPDEKPPFLESVLQSATIVRDGPKVGRNDPCPCGSGKKYKRCCLKE